MDTIQLSDSVAKRINFLSGASVDSRHIFLLAYWMARDSQLSTMFTTLSHDMEELEEAKIRKV